ncbi:hypothetical protein BVY04_01140 [bacterium M21]|nr:hypothetical protein BVY04_01140 [bacterium M21]
MPNSDTLEKMEHFETSLTEVVESDLTAFLAGTMTMSGYRQWLFCCENIDTVIERLTGITPNDSPFPIQLEGDQKTSWEYYFSAFNK